MFLPDLAQQMKQYRKYVKSMTQLEAAMDAGIPLGTFMLAERGSMGVKVQRKVRAWLSGYSTSAPVKNKQRKGQRHGTAVGSR